MDRKKLIESYREEVGKWRSKFLQLEVDTVEQRAYDEVRKWRLSFDPSSSTKQVERVLNEIEKRKQAEVSRLGNELRVSLAEFKNNHLRRIGELDKFISSMDLDDDLQLDYIKFELESIANALRSLHVNIVVQVIDNSKRRRLSTPLTRNALELVKVFEFKDPQTELSSPTSCCEKLQDFVRRASVCGASYYNIGILGQKKHF